MVNKKEWTKPYTATQVLRDRKMAMIRKHLIPGIGFELLPRKEKTMSILYRVPVADIIKVWEAQKANYLKDLEEALTTARELKEKGVEDSCVNGKIDSARTNAAMISLQLKYVDTEQEIFMQDHEMYGLFGAHRNLGPGDNPQVATERRY
jgi:hypothetical protein